MSLISTAFTTFQSNFQIINGSSVKVKMKQYKNEGGGGYLIFLQFDGRILCPKIKKLRYQQLESNYDNKLKR